MNSAPVTQAGAFSLLEGIYPARPKVKPRPWGDAGASGLSEWGKPGAHRAFLIWGELQVGALHVLLGGAAHPYPKRLPVYFASGGSMTASGIPPGPFGFGRRRFCRLSRLRFICSEHTTQTARPMMASSTAITRKVATSCIGRTDRTKEARDGTPGENESAVTQLGQRVQIFGRRLQSARP